MLEQYLVDRVAARMRDGVLASHLDSYADLLSRLGYAKATGRRKLYVVERLGRWLRRENLQVSDLGEPTVEAFVNEWLAGGSQQGADRLAVFDFLAFLRSEGVVAAREQTDDRSPLGRLQTRYKRYLKVERGLAPATWERYWPTVHRFLVERFGEDAPSPRLLEPKDVSGFVLRQARFTAAGRAQLMVTALRSFFRFLYQKGEIDRDLAACTPTLARWKLSTVPKYVAQEEASRVLATCDRSDPVGRRNYAILLLLARLGLRAGEVVALELDDIDWRLGEITVRGKGLLHDRLPMPHDVGKALADYLRRDRRHNIATRRLFLRTTAPHLGLGHSSTVSTIVRRAIDKAGVRAAAKGAHLLRHTLATGLLRDGASMAEIGELLRHRSPNTTEIYAKVDIGGLRCLAQPWPETGGVR